MAFVRTSTGYRADDEQVAYWQARDSCPDCGEILSPIGKTADGQWRYRCSPADVNLHEDIEWTRPI